MRILYLRYKFITKQIMVNKIITEMLTPVLYLYFLLTSLIFGLLDPIFSSLLWTGKLASLSSVSVVQGVTGWVIYDKPLINVPKKNHKMLIIFVQLSRPWCWSAEIRANTRRPDNTQDNPVLQTLVIPTKYVMQSRSVLIVRRHTITKYMYVCL